MTDLSKLSADGGRCGVYYLPSEPAGVKPAATSAGLAIFRIDIGRVQSKKEFLLRIAKALNFPEWFGHNWDALNDCLTDLSWLGGSGWVVIIENAKTFAERHPEEFATVVQIFKSATEHWRGKTTPLWILIHDSTDWKPDLPAFPRDRDD